MRKLKTTRTVQKIKNSLDPFYYDWVKSRNLDARLQGKSQKELEKFKVQVMSIVDMLYEELKVEEKYKYYLNLYLLYELLGAYFGRVNEFAVGEAFLNRQSQENASRIKHLLDYEPAFCKALNTKTTEALYWLKLAITEILRNYIGRIRDENIMALTAEIEGYAETQAYCFKRDEPKIKNEIILLNILLVRIKYAREHISVIYSYNKAFALEDKHLRTMIKGALTRIEKVVNAICEDIESIPQSAINNTLGVQKNA